MANAEPGAFTFGLTGGMAMPRSDFSDGFNTGFNGGVFGDYWIGNSFGLGADVMYNRMSAKDEYESSQLVDKITAEVMQFGGHVKLLFAGQGAPVSPWLQAGVASYNMKVKVDDVLGSAESSSSDMGFNGGAGLNFWSSSSMGLGVGGMYHHITTEDKATQYITAGLNLTFSTTGTSSMGGR
jgi:hypothetical protein